MGSHRAIFGEITERMIRPAADLDLPEFASRQTATVSVDDSEVVIGKWPADRAEAALLAGNRGDPVDLAGAIALCDADAEFLLEPLPFVEQQWRRARRDESQLGQIIALQMSFAVEQNVERGRIAGGDRYAVVAQMGKEATCREFFGEHQSSAAIDRSERAQKLR